MPPDPAAPLVEMDITAYYQHQPGGDSFVRIWGISLETARNAQQLTYSAITIRGGMGKGFPLANPQQAGLLITGTVFQPFANWVGTSQTLDMYLTSTWTQAQTEEQQTNQSIPPINISLNAPAGSQLSAAVQQALQTAFPNATIKINISSQLTVPVQQAGVYRSLSEFGQWLQQYTQQIIGGNYSGVNIYVGADGVINVTDSSTTSSQQAKQINFNDMVGQVTWVNFNTVHLPCIMRGDINVGDTIMMPPGQVTTTSSSFSQFRQNAVIQGQFQVIKVRHVGNSRDPSGLAWVTNMFAVTLPASS